MTTYKRRLLRQYLEKMYSAASKRNFEEVRRINQEFSPLEEELFGMNSSPYDLARNEIINSFQEGLSIKDSLKKAKSIIDSL